MCLTCEFFDRATRGEVHPTDGFHLGNLKGSGNANNVYQVRWDCQEAPIDLVARCSKGPKKDSMLDPKIIALEEDMWMKRGYKIRRDGGGIDHIRYVSAILSSQIGLKYLPLMMVASDIKGCCSAILMPDATVLVGVPHEATVCLEIKPKFGSILRCETIQDSRHRHLKHTRSRYSLHQTLKLQQGLIKEKSEYEPLDLFSGDAMRMHASLVALFNNPQNNLKAFIGGERVSCDDEELCRVLFDPTQCSSRQEYMDMMASLVSRILLQENVLENILAVQTKCTYDIQAVEQMLECLVKGTPMMPDEYNRFLHVLSTYCESATAKDCSIMITMAKDDIQTDTTQQSFKPCNHGCIPLSDTTGASCRYRVTVVDLDRKSLAKITSHASLDRNILESNMIHSDIQ